MSKIVSRRLRVASGRRDREAAGPRKIYMSRHPPSGTTGSLVSGGDSGARTRSLRLAKPALSQLSYIPGTPGLRPTAARRWSVVGLGGLEPPTSRLSGVRSNQLSYRPTPSASSRRKSSPQGRLAPPRRSLATGPRGAELGEAPTGTRRARPACRPGSRASPKLQKREEQRTNLRPGEVDLG